MQIKDFFYLFALGTMKGNELKPHIGIFGRRNYGKSSLINFLTGQPIAIVSDVPGTTADPVKKTMEISGIGPVVWVDTAGIDDSGDLGSLRAQRSDQTLPAMDLAIILFSNNRFDDPERHLVSLCRHAHVPFLLLYSQSDKVAPVPDLISSVESQLSSPVFSFSVFNPECRQPILDLIKSSLPESSYHQPSLLGDVISEGDIVLLVAPIDSSAPEGRLILPQVQVIRDILDNNATAVVCKDSELRSSLNSLSQPPRLVITDSQVFPSVANIVPDDIFLTSFSVVLARAKGLFHEYVQGTFAVDTLRHGDRVLLLESCTHNVTCEDIGRVKLPNLISKHTGKTLQFDILGGSTPIPRPITHYALVVQCGGCVVTAQQLRARLGSAVQQGVPISNYGLMLAHLNGILKRSIQIFE